ncbi:hypothetical protein Ahy_A03g016164 [Arachis hypogaea]|uniref:Aminotransferase-like plant mobile domain-containing protein n=1 Tax=Arachis hypogaea TaxID=3818 RepID=A0A445E2E7_ARAHY|nr:hypothetical protein Ahy_A03g016164 [Arachis hypogaea]
MLDLWMLICDHFMLSDLYNQIVEGYVKCHIMLLFETILFGDKLGAAFSWGSACLAHLYRSLCRATRVDCKGMDSPLTLLLTWVSIRLPFLAPISGNSRVWYNWDRENYAYRYHSLVHYRRLLDDLQEGHAYDIERIESDVISLDIRHHSIIWSATVRLYFSNASSGMHSIKLGGNLGIHNQERYLGASHGEVLTGPKKQDWADTYSFWVMQWTNRYSHVLADDFVPLHYPLKIYLHWYRRYLRIHIFS